MSPKEEILNLLYFYAPNYFSAENLSYRLGIKRATVLRYIDELRQEGFDIHSCKNRGFSLGVPDDELTPEAFVQYFRTERDKVRIFASLPSTNTTAKEMAECGAPEGTIIIAEQQTGGRGRMNRHFYSPKRAGLYMSLILRPSLPIADTLLITTLAAVAVAEAAEQLTAHPAQIKWVNDVYFREKKVSGILTEAAINTETQKTEYVILGIGVNIFTPKSNYPSDIRDIAGALFEAPIPHGRCRVAAHILNRFYHYYNNIEQRTFLKPYQKRSLLTGRKVEVLRGNETYCASVVGINDDFSLRILLPDGQMQNLSSGEVSVHIEHEEEN